MTVKEMGRPWQHGAIGRYTSSARTNVSRARGSCDMAKVWPIYGERQKHSAELPWLECVQRFDLSDAQGTADRPRGGGKPTEHITGVVVEPTESEVRQHGLRPGLLYISPLPSAKVGRLWLELKASFDG